MQSTSEEWRAVRDWEGFYEVSDLGRVRSVPREQVRLNKCGKPSTYRYGYKLLKPGTKDTGYQLVILSDVTNGRQKVARVHQLVCEAFNGPRPGWDYEVAHADHVKTNNVPGNLRWTTHFDNIQDSVRDGRMAGKPSVAGNNSGVIGVSWDKHKRRWQVHFRNRKIGNFKDFEIAVAARERAEREQLGGVEVSSAA